MKRIFELCQEFDVRTEQIICLATIMTNGDIDFSMVEDLLDSICEDKETLREEDQTPEDMLRHMIDKGQLGFWVQVATPIREYRSETSCSYSWSMYYTRWVYGETFQEAMEKGFQWTKTMNQKDRQKWSEGKEPS